VVTRIYFLTHKGQNPLQGIPKEGRTGSKRIGTVHDCRCFYAYIHAPCTISQKYLQMRKWFLQRQPVSCVSLRTALSFSVRSRDRALHTDSLAVPDRDVAQCSETERCVCRSKIGNQPASFGVPNGPDITVQAESSSEARRIVMEMIPGRDRCQTPR
jgi:hypothetical protein